MDIANAARAFLAKTSLKEFTHGERQALIEEGDGVLASNFDRLDLTGTHYEALEEAYQMVDDDEGLFY
jgi:hypothetical protein